ncbi:MAG: methylation-associated defense system protein MAD4 [Anaerolineae bacterium]
MPALPYDLVILVADKDMEHGLKGLLSRWQSLQIRPVTYNIFSHPEHDPGCLRDAVDILRSQMHSHRHALVLFDREGCGCSDTPEVISGRIEQQLAHCGWKDRQAAIVFDPELEVWVWSRSPNVDRVLGWEGKTPSLRSWLQEQGYVGEQNTKPSRPKEALEEALRAAGEPRSASLYRRLAETVSLQGHNEPAFTKLCTVLRTWFPAAS